MTAPRLVAWLAVPARWYLGLLFVVLDNDPDLTPGDPARLVAMLDRQLHGIAPRHAEISHPPGDTAHEPDTNRFRRFAAPK